MKRNIAVILSGCGFQDGAEVHESVMTLLALSQRGVSYQCFAPDMAQLKIVNHLTNEDVAGETRNVLVESARIARGAIKPLSEFNADNFDALILPGGFGAALNLSNFAVVGADFEVHPEVKHAVNAIHGAGKPIGALCIAPVIIAKLITASVVTIGGNEGVADAIATIGATHKNTTHGEIVIDKANKVVTTPCYMLDASVAQIYQGADNLVAKVLEMC